jgi:tRNA threonylcarbamoyladenosine modification (KEOPS) complex Cgi121 subunit
MEEIMLAHYLAKRSFKEKTNIAKSLHIEFLLWFAGTRDIEKAFEYAMFDNTRDFVLLSFSKQNEHTKGHIIKLLRAKEKKLVIKKKADPLCLERISLSRL